MDKKKRHTSGSRSKSKKSKPNQFSVDLKTHKLPNWVLNNDPTKIKTQNSVNKSKGTTNSKKHNKCKHPAKYFESQMQTQHQVQSTNTIIQDISHSVSADRKHSLNKINRTEANYLESQDFDRKIFSLKKSLSKIVKPRHTDIKDIQSYFKQIETVIEYVSEPLGSILSMLHSLYVQPLNMLLDAITPYEDLIKKKQIISAQIEAQIQQNQRLYQQIDPQNLQILQLQQKIQQQKQIIEEKKRIKNAHNLTKKYKDRQSSIIKIGQDEGKDKKVISFGLNYQGIANKGFKLDLDNVNKTNAQGFHDEFYSKIDQFSESWRNQAIRQKRF